MPSIKSCSPVGRIREEAKFLLSVDLEYVKFGRSAALCCTWLKQFKICNFLKFQVGFTQLRLLSPSSCPSTAAGMVLSPESPLGSASNRDLQDLLDNKLYYSQTGLPNSDTGSRNCEVGVASENPWAAPSDVWGHDDSLMNTRGQIHLTFLDPKRIRSVGSPSPFEGSGDSLRLDAAAVAPGKLTLQDGMSPVDPRHSLHSAGMVESPIRSSLSKENSDREVKQEIRAESSDGSDALDDDDDKGGARSSRRHLSKNLVAERKRRKKLNERLYSLRALVPKITKVSSI